MKQQPCTPDLIAALRLISDEVPDNCTPAEAWKYVRPVTKRGQMFPRWSFWGLLNAALVSAPTHSADARHATIAAFVRNKYERAQRTGGAWPPVVVTANGRPAVPMPWDGKK